MKNYYIAKWKLRWNPKIVLVFFNVFLIAFPVSIKAVDSEIPSLADWDEVQEALKQLAELKQRFASVDPFVKKHHKARFFVLNKKITNVEEVIKETQKCGHTRTLNEYHSLIVAFRNSQTYLKEIEVPLSRPSLDRVKEIVASIELDRGFNEKDYTTYVTQDYFGQIYQIIVSQLQDKILPELDSEKKIEITDEKKALLGNLYEDLMGLKGPLGELLAIANQGDRPRTFQKAYEVSEKIKSLYKKFIKVDSTLSVYAIVLEIQGINEMYSEFAQGFEGVEKLSPNSESQEAESKK